MNAKFVPMISLRKLQLLAAILLAIFPRAAIGAELFHLESPYEFKAYQHKVQLHAHTTDSDGDHSPQWVMQAYEARGYTAVAKTDHDYSDHSSILEDPGGHNIIHIPGVEYSYDDLKNSVSHMLGIHIQTIHHEDGMGARQEQIDQATAEGGLTFLCHPYDPGIYQRGWSSAQVAAVDGYTGMEIQNGGSYYDPEGRYNYVYKVDLALVAGREIRIIAVDDFHRNPETTMDRGHVVVNSDYDRETVTL